MYCLCWYAAKFQYKNEQFHLRWLSFLTRLVAHELLLKATVLERYPQSLKKKQHTKCYHMHLFFLQNLINGTAKLPFLVSIIECLCYFYRYFFRDMFIN